MRLVAFQVKGCFGFQDSGAVNLKDASNLIFVLGRNSSGKTAFLSALAHFSPKVAITEDRRFTNFGPTEGAAELIAEFEIDRAAPSMERMATDLTQAVRQANQVDSVLRDSTEFETYLVGVREGVISEWSAFIAEVAQAGRFWVKRARSGQYAFSAHGDFSDFGDLEKKTNDAFAAALARIRPANAPGVHQIPVSGNWRELQPATVAQIGEALAWQLPGIEWLTGPRPKLPLNDDLPDRLELAHLESQQSPLVEALIEYLGRENLKVDLTIHNPMRQRQLEDEMQDRITQLVTTINRSEAGKQDLVRVDLKRSDGLQITFQTSEKSSFYYQISDNTKFLFAYYLYQAAGMLKGSILLFDEPNNGFHATAQEQLLNFLEALGHEGNLVIVSTHSEHLIDTAHLTCIRVMGVDDEKYLRVYNHWYGEPGESKEAGNMLALQPLVDAIGLKYGMSQLLIHDHVVVVEGVTDLAYLRAFHQILSSPGGLYIAPARGAATIPYVVALIISQGLQFKVLLDRDIAPSAIKIQLEQDYGIPGKFIHEVPIPPGFSSKASSAGIEDVLSKTDFEKLLEQAGVPVESDFAHVSNAMYMGDKRRSKLKSVVADWFLENVAKYRQTDFDAETLGNMRAVMDFCLNDDWLSK